MNEIKNAEYEVLDNISPEFIDNDSENKGISTVDDASVEISSKFNIDNLTEEQKAELMAMYMKNLMHNKRSRRSYTTKKITPKQRKKKRSIQKNSRKQNRK